MTENFTETLGHYNVFRKNLPRIVSGDVDMFCRRTSVFDLNEVIPGLYKTVKGVIRDHKFDFVHVGSVWLIWDPKVWDETQFTRRVQLCPPARKLGYDIPFHPARHLLAQGLVHKASNTLHRMEAAHLPQGYAKESGEKDARIARVEDIQAKLAVHKLDLVTERWSNNSREYEFEHLSGDFNERYDNQAELWYPSVVLRDRWSPEHTEGLDWMIHTLRSERNGLKVVKNWAEHGPEWNSDHPARFKEVKFPAASKR